MAVIALVPICPVVPVILAMTTYTTADCQCHFIVGRSFVALGATYVLVFSFQLEFGLVVVEIPIFPIPRVVAIPAIRAQRALVHVLLLMTRPAVRLGILECDSQVAFLAFGQQMFSGEREAGKPVVKCL